MTLSPMKPNPAAPPKRSSSTANFPRTPYMFNKLRTIWSDSPIPTTAPVAMME